MRLLRFGPEGREKVGLLHDGQVRDLSAHVPVLSGAALNPTTLAGLAALDPLALPLVENPGRIGACIEPSGKIVCVGLNYADHAREAGMTPPPEPIIFMKGCRLTGPTDPISMPPGAQTVDWEIELTVVIGRPVLMADRERALSAIAGYAAFVDMSERDWQMKRQGQWVKGKSWPGFAPIGPWLVTPDEIADPQDLHIWLDVNGQRFQDGNTRDMIAGCVDVVAYISQFMQLDPGDVIATGTPAGVGMGLKPPRYLAAGDSLRAGIQGLGEQAHDCVAWTPA
ncbi:MAG: hydrolase family protein [Caulobacter sp.]|nr:hydrolase family protein [Caulobacter sp.]